MSGGLPGQTLILVTEAALRWRPGPPNVLIAQLGRVSALGTLDNVSVGIIPSDAEAVTFTSHGFAIYDTVQYVRPDVRTLCVGLAASAAAVLLAAGAPGKRSALPNAESLMPA